MKDFIIAMDTIISHHQTKIFKEITVLILVF